MGLNIPLRSTYNFFDITKDTKFIFSVSFFLNSFLTASLHLIHYHLNIVEFTIFKLTVSLNSMPLKTKLVEQIVIKLSAKLNS